MQSITDAGLNFITKIERFSAVPYNDPPGSNKYSIGYGHQIQPGETFTRIDEAKARELLAADTAHAQAAVRAAIKVPLTPEQFDMLTSFVYNVGASAFNAGTVPAKINAGDFASAAATMKQYTKSGGVVNMALVKRRIAESSVFA